nr:MAG TPA: hypothetical protein [Caudoviricetes sp.]
MRISSLSRTCLSSQAFLIKAFSRLVNSKNSDFVVPKLTK